MLERLLAWSGQVAAEAAGLVLVVAVRALILAAAAAASGRMVEDVVVLACDGARKHRIWALDCSP